MEIEKLVRAQREFFRSGATLETRFRLDALGKLERAIVAHEGELNAALLADLGKSRTEGYMCEVGLTLSELSYVRAHLRSWAKERRRPTPLAQFCAKSFTLCVPYGVTLIMSPRNYPILLTLEPLVGAIAAGNCCVVKPSAYSPATSAVLAKLLGECFAPEYVAVVTGGRAENAALLEQTFDYIFFTGSVAVGKLVMEKAARSLTPVTLELGGKSPVIIDETANLPVAARRLVFGKYLNCGQTCVAPDYVLVHESVHDRLLALVRQEITRQFGEKPLENPDYGKMVNEKHFRRVLGLIDRSKLAFGGEAAEKTLQIAPTVLTDVTTDDAVMGEEIFGPVLPLIRYRELGEALDFIRSRPTPLALYLFTSSRAVEKRVLRAVPFGGGCVNDTVIHLATSAMGFGGMGASGMGSYHGRKSFDTFSHEKSIVRKYTFLDLPLRYQPYTALKERIIRLFLR